MWGVQGVGAPGTAVSWARQNNNSGSALSCACLVRVWWLVEEALIVTALLLPVYPHSTVWSCWSYSATGAILLSVIVSARDHDPPDSSCRLVPPSLRQEDTRDTALYIGQLVLQ